MAAVRQGRIMSTRIFRYLLAVQHYRHFRNAAVSCQVSQSTLSTQIRRYEAYIGADIFVRGRNGVKLTEAGKDIMGSVETIVQAMDEIRSIGRSNRTAA